MKAVVTDLKGKKHEVRLHGTYRWAGVQNGVYRVITDQDTVEFNLQTLLFVRLIFGKDEEPPKDPHGFSTRHGARYMEDQRPPAEEEEGG